MINFVVIRTHLSYHFRRAVYFLGLRRNGSSSQIIDQSQNLLEQAPWHGHLGQLESDVAAMADDVGSNLDQLFSQRGYSCQWCGHQISPMEGTLFERTHTPLTKWFYAMYLFTTSRHGVPAKELQRQLGVTYKTAWRIGHEIRKSMGTVDGDPPLGGHVEADETYVGGRRSGGKRGRGAPGKRTCPQMRPKAPPERREG